MPEMDGTGPRGTGPRTGWGLGRCRPQPDQPDDPENETPDDDPPTALFWRRGGGRGGLGRWGRGFPWRRRS
jgi:hypothetical protein